MLGAIIGDIVGSRWEFNPNRSKDFEFLSKYNSFTDDTVMTLAIAKSLLDSKLDYSDLSELTIKNIAVHLDKTSKISQSILMG